jgi:hypothetical protein
VAPSVPDLPQLAPRIIDVDLNNAMDEDLAPTCGQDMQVRLPDLEEVPRLKKDSAPPDLDRSPLICPP